MRKNELALQREIVKSVKREGGFAWKTASSMQVGVLDIIAALPGFKSAFYIEVKDLGEVIDGFSRDIGLSAKQKITLNTVNHLRTTSKYEFGLVSVVLVGFWQNGNRYLARMNSGETRLVQDDTFGARPIIKRVPPKHWGLSGLLAGVR